MCDSPAGVSGDATAAAGRAFACGRHGADEVARVAVLRRLRIDEVRALAHGLGRQASGSARLARPAIDVKRHVGRIRLQQTPTHIHRSVGLPHGHKTPVELLGHLRRNSGTEQQK